MKTTMALCMLATVSIAGEWALVGIREETVVQDGVLYIDIDIHSTSERVASRRLMIRDRKMQARMFSDPFLVPVNDVLAYLVAREKRGVRCLRIAWERGEQIGESFFIRTDSRGRVIMLPRERVAFLARNGIQVVNLRTATAKRVGVTRPICLDPKLGSLFVARATRVHRYALDGVTLKLGDAVPHFPLPDEMQPRIAAARADGLQLAYAAQTRPGRFVLSVVDPTPRLLLRRSFVGRARDIRWIDDTHVLVTATDDERTTAYVASLKQGERPRWLRMPARFLAPPEIVPMARLGLRKAN